MSHVLRESHADLRTLLEPSELVAVAQWHGEDMLIATLELITRPVPVLQLRLRSNEVLAAPDPGSWPTGFRTFADLAADRAAFMAPGEIPAAELQLDRVRRLRGDYLRELDRTVAYLRPHYVTWALREVRAHLARHDAAGADCQVPRAAS